MCWSAAETWKTGEGAGVCHEKISSRGTMDAAEERYDAEGGRGGTKAGKDKETTCRSLNRRGGNRAVRRVGPFVATVSELKGKADSMGKLKWETCFVRPPKSKDHEGLDIRARKEFSRARLLRTQSTVQTSKVQSLLGLGCFGIFSGDIRKQ